MVSRLLSGPLNAQLIVIVLTRLVVSTDDPRCFDRASYDVVVSPQSSRAPGEDNVPGIEVVLDVLKKKKKKLPWV